MFLWMEDTEESSNSIFLNLLFWGELSDTEDIAPFYDISGGFGILYYAETDLVFWCPGRILTSFISTPYASLIMR